MLKVRNLRRPGLTAVALEVAAGECCTVTGESGAGKSLLLRAIADLDENWGEVSAAGRDRSALSGPQWRRLVSFVAAESGWWAERIGDHLHNHETAVTLATALRLPPDCLDWPVARLSTGERQRLALVRALEQTPAVLLLDEPTAALDAAATAAVEQLLRTRLDQGTAILIVTHDPAQAARLGRRGYQVEAGIVTELSR